MRESHLPTKPCCYNVVLGGDVLHQHGVDRHTDDNEERLEAQGQQAAQVVLAHAAPFLAHHGRHRDGSHRRDKYGNTVP